MCFLVYSFLSSSKDNVFSLSLVNPIWIKWKNHCHQTTKWWKTKNKLEKNFPRDFLSTKNASKINSRFCLLWVWRLIIIVMMLLIQALRTNINSAEGKNFKSPNEIIRKWWLKIDWILRKIKHKLNNHIPVLLMTCNVSKFFDKAF